MEQAKRALQLSTLIQAPVGDKSLGFLKSSTKGLTITGENEKNRGLQIQGEDDSYDFGSGAGFYVDATRDPWSKGYKMYSYVTEELPKTLFGAFPQLDSSRMSITGHSMGGHGALTLVGCPHGGVAASLDVVIDKDIVSQESGEIQVLFCLCADCESDKLSLGPEGLQGKWKEHDAAELIKQWKGPLDLLIDVGTGDNFYKQGQLLPENFVKAAKEAGVDKDVKLRMQPDYDHSYYFMATFADDHIAHAAKHLLS
ncbi:MAG: hypothetical protein Q9157_005953 [Trypethelium eluteriae]